MFEQTSLFKEKSPEPLDDLLSAIDSGAENNTWILLAGGANSGAVRYRPGDEFENSSNGTQEVGRKKPNELGLYDMSGNVWEWCNDLLGNYSYAQQNNPVGAYSGTFYVFRGGSWVNEPWYARVSMRNGNQPRVRSVNLGLRLAL